VKLDAFPPYPHQIADVQFLARRGRAILAEDIGLGKTRQPIVAMNQAVILGAVLFVCPASLKLNLAREIRLLDPTAEVEVIGMPGERSGCVRWMDWVTANHLQAEDRCYRIGQQKLKAKLRLVHALGAEQLPDASVWREPKATLQRLGPALLHKARAAQAGGTVAAQLNAIDEMAGALAKGAPFVETGAWEFPSSRDPHGVYRVVFGRCGDLQRSYPRFEHRGECRHVCAVRKTALTV